MALECKPTSHFLTAFNFSLSSPSVSFSPTHPPSPLSFLSPLSASQWPSPTQSLEQCEWEIACVTKAIKRTHARVDKQPLSTSMQVKIHKCIANNVTYDNTHQQLQRHLNTTQAHKNTTDLHSHKCLYTILHYPYFMLNT